jgi:hypothetical protein
MKKIITLFFLLLLTNRLFSHTDRTFSFTYENVTVMFHTGSYYEELEKAKIAGKAVAKLSSIYGFKENILLYFEHDYAYQRESHIFLSFGKPYYIWELDELVFHVPDHLTGEYLVIRQLDSIFDIKNTLKLAEYGINNINALKTEEFQEVKLKKEMSSPDRFLVRTFNSLDRKHVNKILAAELTGKGQNAMQAKFYKEEAYPQSISYFFQNNEFVVFLRDRQGKEIIIDTLPEIRYFKSLLDEYFFLFSSWGEFTYYEKKIVPNSFSAEIIPNVKIEGIKNDLYKYISIELLSNNTFKIEHWGVMPFPKNISIFSTETKEIIETKHEY